jgi:hypothetical protein
VTGIFCTRGNERNWYERSWSIARKKHSSDQIVAILRQVEIAAANSFKSPVVLSQKP